MAPTQGQQTRVQTWASPVMEYVQMLLLMVISQLVDAITYVLGEDVAVLLGVAGGPSRMHQSPRDVVTQEVEEVAAVGAVAAPRGSSPSTWHQNDLSFGIDWCLNPMALDMHPVDFFGRGYGDLTDLELLTSSAGSSSPSPQPMTRGRRPVLSVSIPEPQETLEMTKRVVTPVFLLRPASPLLPLTPSQVNARAPFPPSPLKTTSIEVGKAPSHERVKESELGSADVHRAVDAVAPRGTTKRRPRSTRSAPRAAPSVPLTSTSDVGSGREDRASREARMLARQAAAALQHVARQDRRSSRAQAL